MNEIDFNRDNTEDTSPQLIQKEEFDFYVDIYAGVTVAVMKDPLKYFEDSLWYKYSRTAPQEGGRIVGVYYPHLLDKFKAPIRAKTTVRGTDEFSLEEGMRIARDKCLEKFYKKATQVFVDINNGLEDSISHAEDYFIKTASLYQIYKNKAHPGADTHEDTVILPSEEEEN